MRAPKSLAQKNPQFELFRAVDQFGMDDRLDAIFETFEKFSLTFDSINDLGGNCGFFSLSLLELFQDASSSVYDKNANFLKIGEEFAKYMELRNRIKFVEQSLNLSFIENDLSYADMTLCLNLIHHAGYLFDSDFVLEKGWEAYSSEWLKQMQKKTRILVLGVGFKESLPMYWIKPTRLLRYDSRPLQFLKIAKSSGWKLLYEANVADIHRYGVASAQGKRMKPKLSLFFKALSELVEFLFKLKYKAEEIFKITLRTSYSRSNRRKKYHLYIFTLD